jgi:hypothetical protein
MSFPINTNIPAAGNDPADDQPLMQQNYANINSFLAVDHVEAGAVNNGYHNIIHQVVQGSDPAPITGINQVYQKIYITDNAAHDTDTQLFNMTGLGGISQLTGNSTGGQDGSDGWCWVGGVLLQWGSVSVAGTSAFGTVTFQNRTIGIHLGSGIPFPNFCFMVQATIGVSSVNGFQATMQISGIPTKTSFDWGYSATNSSTFNKFFWFAIGN